MECGTLIPSPFGYEKHHGLSQSLLFQVVLILVVLGSQKIRGFGKFAHLIAWVCGRCQLLLFRLHICLFGITVVFTVQVIVGLHSCVGSRQVVVQFSIVVFVWFVCRYSMAPHQ